MEDMRNKAAREAEKMKAIRISEWTMGLDIKIL